MSVLINLLNTSLISKHTSISFYILVQSKLQGCHSAAEATFQAVATLAFIGNLQTSLTGTSLARLQHWCDQQLQTTTCKSSRKRADTLRDIVWLHSTMQVEHTTFVANLVHKPCVMHTKSSYVLNCVYQRVSQPTEVVQNISQFIFIRYNIEDYLCSLDICQCNCL